MILRKFHSSLSAIFGVLAFVQTQAVSAQPLSTDQHEAMCKLGRILLPDNAGVNRACTCRPSQGVDCGMDIPEQSSPPVQHVGVLLPTDILSKDVKGLLISSSDLTNASDPRVSICVFTNFGEGDKLSEHANNYARSMRDYLSNNIGGGASNIIIKRPSFTRNIDGTNVKDGDNAIVYVRACK